MPVTSPGNLRSSPAMASSRPHTRAMPSPTCSTDPTLSSWTLDSYRSSSCWMTALTSSGRNDISLSLVRYLDPAPAAAGLDPCYRSQLLAQPLDPVPDAAVDQTIL